MEKDKTSLKKNTQESSLSVAKLVSKSQSECALAPTGVTPSSFIHSCLREHQQINNCSAPERRGPHLMIMERLIKYGGSTQRTHTRSSCTRSRLWVVLNFHTDKYAHSAFQKATDGNNTFHFELYQQHLSVVNKLSNGLTSHSLQEIWKKI